MDVHVHEAAAELVLETHHRGLRRQAQRRRIEIADVHGPHLAVLGDDSDVRDRRFAGIARSLPACRIIGWATGAAGCAG